MKRIIYFSKSVQAFSSEDLQGLQDHAALYNESKNISGILTYRDDTFLQYLEGDAVEIDHLIKKITNDPRHRILKILDLKTAANRVFGDWGMKIFLPDAVDGVINDYCIFLMNNVHGLELEDVHMDSLLIKNLIILSKVSKGTKTSARYTLGV